MVRVGVAFIFDDCDGRYDLVELSSVVESLFED